MQRFLYFLVGYCLVGGRHHQEDDGYYLDQFHSATGGSGDVQMLLSKGSPLRRHFQWKITAGTVAIAYYESVRLQDTYKTSANVLSVLDVDCSVGFMLDSLAHMTSKISLTYHGISRNESHIARAKALHVPEASFSMISLEDIQDSSYDIVLVSNGPWYEHDNQNNQQTIHQLARIARLWVIIAETSVMFNHPVHGVSVTSVGNEEQDNPSQPIIQESQLLECALHSTNHLSLHTRIVTDVDTDMLPSTPTLAGLQGIVTYLFRCHNLSSTSSSPPLSSPHLPALDFFTLGLGLHYIYLMADGIPRKIVVNLGVESSSMVLERIRGLLAVGDTPSEWKKVGDIFRMGLAQKLSDVLQEVALDGWSAWETIRLSRIAMEEVMPTKEMDNQFVPSTNAVEGTIASLIRENIHALLETYCMHQYGLIVAATSSMTSSPIESISQPCSDMQIMSPSLFQPSSSSQKGVGNNNDTNNNDDWDKYHRTIHARDWKLVTSLLLPPSATDYNALVAFAAMSLKSHASSKAGTTTTATATTTPAFSGVGDDDSNSDGDRTHKDDDNKTIHHPSVADLNPVCLFVQQHLILFSIDTLLSTHYIDGSPISPNITAIAMIEHKVGLMRNVFLPVDIDTKDLADSNIHSGHFTSNRSIEKNEDNYWASAWPPDIQQLLEFRRIIDSTTAGRWEPLSIIRDACRLMQYIPTLTVGKSTTRITDTDTDASTLASTASQNNTCTTDTTPRMMLAVETFLEEYGSGRQCYDHNYRSNNNNNNNSIHSDNIDYIHTDSKRPIIETGNEVIRSFHHALQKRQLQLSLGEMLIPSCGTKIHPLSSLTDGKLTGRHPAHLQGTSCEPWIDRGIIFILDRILQPTMKGLEWGAGASSFWLLQRLHKLISVEHDQTFYASLRKHAHRTWPIELFAQKWFLLHVPYDETINTIGGDPTILSILPYTHDDPYSFATDIKSVETNSTASFGYGIPYVDAPWKKKSTVYVSSSSSSSSTAANAHNLHDQSFQSPPLDPQELLDFIFIDGKARGSCLARAVMSIQPHGGILVLDNSNRLEYRRVIQKYIPCHWIKYAENNVAQPETETTIWITTGQRS